MTENEAISRIIDHFDVHHHDNRPHPLLDKAVEMAIKALEEVQKYRKIGTMEECRAAMEKQTARKATTNHSWTHYHFFCPVCKKEVNDMKYCPSCGQKLDWRDEDDGN